MMFGLKCGNKKKRAIKSIVLFFDCHYAIPRPYYSHRRKRGLRAACIRTLTHHKLPVNIFVSFLLPILFKFGILFKLLFGGFPDCFTRICFGYDS